MLTSTFVHVPGIGYGTERKIWESGVFNWKQYMDLHDDLDISTNKKALMLPRVEESIGKLAEGDFAYFSRTLASKDHWRALSEFGGHLGYLDIETTGCNWNDQITVIGLYDGYEMRSFVQGINMDEFPTAISKCKMLVTFFGSGFDIPFIRRVFPDLRLDQLHIDLCHLMRRIGLTGGLKRIEGQLGIHRRPEAEGMDGFDAVRLWHEYRRGSREALDLLLLYNEEDVMNMEMLLAYGCRELTKGLSDCGLPISDFGLKAI